MNHQGSAIITGGTSGIGLAAARLLLRQGQEVTLWARDARRGGDAVRQLDAERHPGKVGFQQCDVADADSVRRAAAAFTATRDTLDILVNAAGVLTRTPLGESRPNDIVGQVNTVLTGTILATTALAPCLARAGRGVVVNVGSVAGQHPVVGLGAYGAAKAGVAHFTRVAAQELFTSGVRVLCICPGVVKTGLFSEAEFSALLNATPGRRLQTAEEVAQFIVELTRPTYPSLTGAVIDLDDGLGLFLNNRPPAPAFGATEARPSTAAAPKHAPTAPAPAAAAPPAASSEQSPAFADPVLARVAAIFHQAFGVDPATVTLQTGPEDVARWDSLGNLRLIASLEKEFACTLDINEIMDMVDVGSIVRVMKGKVR